MGKEREVYKVENNTKCPKYHTPILPWRENTIIFFFFFGSILPEISARTWAF